jgi:hypothetical protein
MVVTGLPLSSHSWLLLLCLAIAGALGFVVLGMHQNPQQRGFTIIAAVAGFAAIVMAYYCYQL